jgi:type II secretory pathway pseudopilin PulG
MEYGPMNRKGFSYTEVLIALAVFCAAIAPIFPALTQVRQNEWYAREHYQAQLYANELLWIVQDALVRNESPERAAESLPETFTHITETSPASVKTPVPFYPLFIYACYIANDGENYSEAAFASPGAPSLLVSAGTVPPGWRIVTAVVWDTEGRMAARAVGVIP